MRQLNLASLVLANEERSDASHFPLRCGSSPNYVELRRLLCAYLLSADISTRFSYGLQGIFENVRDVSCSRFQAVNANSPGNEGQGFYTVSVYALFTPCDILFYACLVF